MSIGPKDPELWEHVGQADRLGSYHGFGIGRPTGDSRSPLSSSKPRWSPSVLHGW